MLAIIGPAVPAMVVGLVTIQSSIGRLDDTLVLPRHQVGSCNTRLYFECQSIDGVSRPVAFKFP